MTMRGHFKHDNERTSFTQIILKPIKKKFTPKETFPVVENFVLQCSKIN